MSKLKIGAIEDEKPITMTVKLPAAVHRDLVAYADLLKRDDGVAIDPNSLVAPMLKRSFRDACANARCEGPRSLPYEAAGFSTEAALAYHPAVLKAAVIGVPDAEALTRDSILLKEEAETTECGSEGVRQE
jgi:hypothetical protein